MRVVCFSDTHKNHEELVVPDGDVLVFGGDMSGRGSLRSVIQFNRWIGTQPHKHKIVIAGNHDWAFRKFGNLTRSELTNATYLEDSRVIIDGVTFYGSPWQPEFCGWAFNLPRGGQLKHKWSCIPDETNVLITHSPPHGIGDFSIIGNEHCGCEDLLDRTKELNDLKLHVFGHIHYSYGLTEIDGVSYVNASSCDEEYRITNPPIVVDI